MLFKFFLKNFIKIFGFGRRISAPNSKSPVVVQSIDDKEVVVKNKTRSKTFEFDKVFSPYAKQKEVFKIAISPLVDDVFLGYNCCVILFGASKTGKSFMILGPTETAALDVILFFHILKC